MSTTVTYKGETLTTVNNQTRTLLTNGTYMEDDITLVDVSGSGGGPDLSNDTVTASTLLEGETAHDSTETAITGELTGMDLLEGEVEIISENLTKMHAIVGFTAWNTTNKKIRSGSLTIPIGSGTVTRKITDGLATIILVALNNEPLQFTNLSSGILVANGGNTVMFSTTAMYILRVTGSKSTKRSFTMSPAAT